MNKSRCTWGCQCERCRAVRDRWHTALTLPGDVLLLPASGFASARMEQSRSPWSMERREMHRECISAEDELQSLIVIAERENKDANVIVSERRIIGRGEDKRFEVTIGQIDNLLEE